MAVDVGKGSLFVGKDEKQPKQFAGDASGRGDDCRQEGVAHAWSSVTLPIFINLLLCPLRERGQCQDGTGCHSSLGVISAAMEVVNRGEGDGDPTNLIQGQSGDIQVRHILLILSARDLGDIPGGGAIASLAEEGHDASLDLVVALGPGGQETTASADVVLRGPHKHRKADGRDTCDCPSPVHEKFVLARHPFKFLLNLPTSSSSSSIYTQPIRPSALES